MIADIIRRPFVLPSVRFRSIVERQFDIDICIYGLGPNGTTCIKQTWRKTQMLGCVNSHPQPKAARTRDHATYLQSFISCLFMPTITMQDG